ncbi:MAG: DUF2917 domain-containing protein [Rhodocyclales bacterium]|nr:DUF2917 domain-containing protein [Rhodocyclales bacterium]
MNASAHLASSLICQSQEKRRALFASMPAQAPVTDATEFHAGMHIPCIERALAKNKLLALPDANTKLICLAGELWLTRDGDIEDYIIGPGQSFVARREDKVTVQALRPSRVRLLAA